MAFEDDLLQDAQEDARIIEFIHAYLPQDLKDKFSDDDLQYFLDVLAEYYADLSEGAGSDDEEVDIDVEAVAKHLVAQAKKEKMGDWKPEDVRWVVEGEFEYWDQQEGEED